MEIITIVFIYYYLFLYSYLYLCVILISLFIVEYLVNPVYYIIFGAELLEIQKIHMYMFICYSVFLIAFINFNETPIKNI